MQMTGEQRISAPRERVWEALNDPAILKACIPGCQSVEKLSDTEYKATVAIRIGPIGAKFDGKIALSDLDPPKSCTITGEGQGGGAGFAKGGAKVRLDEADGGTLLAYDVDAQVGGRLAQVGGALIDATAKRLAGQFFKKFGAVLEEGVPQEEAAPSPAPAPESTGDIVNHETRPPSPPIPAPTTQSLPVGWILAILGTLVFGFLLGRATGEAPGDWAGLAIAVTVIAAAALAFELGRRNAPGEPRR
ncbi:CoxG family protein [Stakelama tenebrarum]|uniref:Carbon monoxide dehydrogenase subunit G n=1 Tax=Stakelama tenebrarum TaxID=2711215 RepID=A0A6G6Y3Z6_9SPHN|nr:carbon monoxide dehydrogenase subunit G [Sphingosinithalassobacter tenebrarum]QIG79652.1 carbon monoxide dehydrogenase subunit G [Sphingosinithalassobacter tenebrarum]